MTGAQRIETAIRAANEAGRPGLVAFLTAGYPDPLQFAEHLATIAEVADVVEIGVPFSDPMADGITIQKASQAAISAGVSLTWILDQVEAGKDRWKAPLILMSYLNPLLAFGPEPLALRCLEAGIDGFIIPDLPLDETAVIDGPLEAAGLALVQLVTPVSSADRLQQLCARSRGFIYAVTVTGTTGGAQSGGPAGPATPDMAKVAAYLDRVRAAARLPVCAGFGIRDHAQVQQLAPHAEGVIVGSALVETLERGEDPAAFLNALKGERITA